MANPIVVPDRLRTLARNPAVRSTIRSAATTALVDLVRRRLGIPYALAAAFLVNAGIEGGKAIWTRYHEQADE